MPLLVIVNRRRRHIDRSRFPLPKCSSRKNDELLIICLNETFFFLTAISSKTAAGSSQATAPFLEVYIVLLTCCHMHAYMPVLTYICTGKLTGFFDWYLTSYVCLSVSLSIFFQTDFLSHQPEKSDPWARYAENENNFGIFLFRYTPWSLMPGWLAGCLPTCLFLNDSFPFLDGIQMYS